MSNQSSDFSTNNIYHPDNSFYTSDGTLTSDRTVDADANSLSVINASEINLLSLINISLPPDSKSYQTLVYDNGTISVRDDSPQGYSAERVRNRKYFAPKPLRVEYSSVLYDYGGYDSGVYTVSVGGLYMIAASAVIRIISASATVSSTLSVCVNGSEVCNDQLTEEYLTSSGGFIQFVSRVNTSLSLNVEDKVEVLYSSDFSGQFLPQGLFYITKVSPN